MLIGKLVSDISADHSQKILGSVEFTDNYVVGDASYGQIEVETTDLEDIVFQIGDEKFLSQYRSGSTFYLVQRGYMNTPIQEHKSGDFIFPVERINVRQLDSRNIYDFQISEQALITRQGDLSLIRGMDVISQDVYLALENVGNDILNKYTTIDLTPASLSQYYELELSRASSFITGVTIKSITVADNKLTAVAEATVEGKVYNNVQFFLPIKENM